MVEQKTDAAENSFHQIGSAVDNNCFQTEAVVVVAAVAAAAVAAAAGQSCSQTEVENSCLQIEVAAVVAAVN